jgi:NAD(P)-dependent dehydrogenase (short-subunit alcohol dehydrogenase family)
MHTRTAGVELAKHNILVVGVGPGAVATPINLLTMNDPAKLAQLNAAIPPGAYGPLGGDCRRGWVPRGRWRKLTHRDHHLRGCRLVRRPAPSRCLTV